jgi:hypothetical protein
MPLPAEYIAENDIPPRLQWNANGGYCGEVSMISAGLFYGQYLSQFDVRQLASPGKGQGDDAQLLLGEDSAINAAKALRLEHVAFASQDSVAFLEWVEQHVWQGFPVIIGVMNNENLLYGNTDPSSGDNEYDHIVPVIGYGSVSAPPFSHFHPENVILFSDNGLYTPGNSTPYYMHFKMQPEKTPGSPPPFLGDRQQANLAAGNIYTLLQLPQNQNEKKSLFNYAMVIKGVADPNKETLRVRVETNLNHELPPIAHGSHTRPSAIPLTLTITVTGLEPTVLYNLYKYDDENQVPTEHFNENAVKAGIKPWQLISITAGTSWTGQLAIRSDQKVFFRAVKA